MWNSTSKTKQFKEYMKQLNFYLIENMNLKSQVEDLSTTLSINKNLLNSYFNQQNPNKKAISLSKEYLRENLRWSKNNSLIYKDKINLAKKLYLLESEYRDRIMQDNITIDEQKETIFLLNNTIMEKDILIKQLKTELDKFYKEDYGTVWKEVYITAPNIIVNELNNELSESKELISKLMREFHAEKQKSLQIQDSLETLQKQIQDIKQGKKIAKTIESISLYDYIPSNNSINHNDDSNSSLSVSNCNSLPTLQSILSNLSEGMENSSSHHQETTVGKKSWFTEIDRNKKMKRNKSTIIPKLNWGDIVKQYKIITPNEINLYTMKSVKNKHINTGDKDFEDKMNNKIKVAQDKANEYKEKYYKYKHMLKALQQNYLVLKQRNEYLENQVKKSSASTNDKSQKSYLENEGWTDSNNTSSNVTGNWVLLNNGRNNQIEDDDDDYLGYIVKEYNKSRLKSIGNNQYEIQLGG